jgi:hypothetical protein
MTARTTLLGLTLGLAALFMAGGALAQCCVSTPPTCCAPPPPPPPSSPPCCTPGHNVNIPGVNVFVAPSVIVNASGSAVAGASASSGARTAVFIGGGGGGGYYAPPVSTGLIQGLNVEGRRSRSAYQATRTRTRRVIIQAVCIDDRQIPHPASQVRPDREVDDLYDGELYRCIAGTSLQATVSEYLGKIDFSKGETMSCHKGDALYHAPHGKVECRPQKSARDCNERSLLRRFGAGIKILTMTIVETYTAYREEERTGAVASSMSLDGGVGGVAY